MYGLDGDVYHYLELAKALGNDQPVYGIRSLALDDPEKQPRSMEEAGARALRWLREVCPDRPPALVGYSWGGILAFEVARQMGVDAVYVEDEGGAKTLRRGQVLPGGARVLVVDDVLTTGLSVRETIDAVREAGGEVVGVGVLIDRAPVVMDFGCPLFASYKVEAESWAPDEVPDWLAAIPVEKPGTRKL